MQVNDKTKFLITTLYFVLFTIVFTFVYLMNMFFNTEITEWWILALTSINIILFIITESFILDDSTGGYKNILDNFHLGIFIVNVLIIILFKKINTYSVSNKTLFIFFLLVNLTTIIIKNILRKYLSENSKT